MRRPELRRRPRPHRHARARRRGRAGQRRRGGRSTRCAPPRRSPGSCPRRAPGPDDRPRGAGDDASRRATRTRAALEAADLVAPGSRPPVPGPRAPRRRRRARAARRARRERTRSGCSGLPDATRVCVVLVDGLGHANLAERAGHAPFLRRRLGDSTPLTSTFPSTTATAMGTFGVALPPGPHGHARLHRPRPRDRAARQPGQLDRAAARARSGSARRPCSSASSRPGTSVTSIGPARFAGSGLTEAALRGPTYKACRVARRPGRRHRGRAAPARRRVPVLGRRRQGGPPPRLGLVAVGRRARRARRRARAARPAACRGTPSWS